MFSMLFRGNKKRKFVHQVKMKDKNVIAKKQSYLMIEMKEI